MRILDHPILGRLEIKKFITIEVDGRTFLAIEGEKIASALISSGKMIFRYTKKFGEPRGIFCAIGKCNDCLVMVDDIPNIRACITDVREGMKIETQYGLGKWEKDIK